MSQQGPELPQGSGLCREQGEKGERSRAGGTQQAGGEWLSSAQPAESQHPKIALPRHKKLNLDKGQMQDRVKGFLETGVRPGCDCSIHPVPGISPGHCWDGRAWAEPWAEGELPGVPRSLLCHSDPVCRNSLLQSLTSVLRRRQGHTGIKCRLLSGA